jgi:excisionase family DNA binding protein
MLQMSERQDTHMLTSEQVAERLNIKERRVQDLLRSGQLIGIKIGKDWRIDPADLDRFIQQRKRK